MMAREYVELGGRRLAWLQAGYGDPIVLLHAFPMTADMWQPQLAAVPHGWRLIAPDLRGLGESSGPPARSVDDHAEDVLALLRHLNIERAVIGGLSMGGYITFALYRLAAQRFRGVVLADTQAGADSAEARVRREQMQQAVRDKGPSAAAEWMLPMVLRPRTLTDPGFVGVRDRVHGIMMSNGPAAIIDAIEVLKTRPDSMSTLALFNVPTLIVVGAEDQGTPPALSEAMHRQIVGAKATKVLIPDAGHLSNLEQPMAFNTALWSFVSGLSAGLVE